MRRFELIAPCHFGMESVLKREITDLGYDITEVADGRVTFFGDEEALCRANIFLRTAERILIKIGSFHAETFEELFQGTKNLPWEEYIPKDGKFWVAKAASVKSKLFSPSDIQSIMKKAMVERLKAQYEISWFPEDGENFPVRVFLMKDEVTVGLDSTGESLHKRGYRKLTAKAPIAENLAAALIELTPWNAGRILVDPFCGSGTFPIELLPDVYQKIYHIFPFPYAIDAMRECICGLYGLTWLKNIGCLLIFGAAALLIGLWVRKPFMGLNHFMEEKLEETEML